MRPASLLLLASAIADADRIPIGVGPGAGDVERTAAAELATLLGKTYPADRFEVASSAAGSGNAILIGSAARELGVSDPAGEESFAAGSRGERRYIVGGSPRGVLHGVYALLERLGWGFNSLMTPRRRRARSDSPSMAGAYRTSRSFATA